MYDHYMTKIMYLVPSTGLSEVLSVALQYEPQLTGIHLIVYSDGMQLDKFANAHLECWTLLAKIKETTYLGELF